MSDRLTQLQTCLDQLVTQYFSSLNFINQSHTLRLPKNSPEHVQLVEVPEGISEEQLHESIKELSRDIVTKSKQIETLINSLPDLENMSSDLQAMETSLEEARQEQAAAQAEREELLQKCDDLVLSLTEYKSSIDRAS